LIMADTSGSAQFDGQSAFASAVARARQVSQTKRKLLVILQ